MPYGSSVLFGSRFIFLMDTLGDFFFVNGYTVTGFCFIIVILF